MPQIGNSRGGRARARKVKRKAPYGPPSSRSDAAQRPGATTPKPKPAPKPSKVELAKRQERAYESQGKAVKKDAKRKTRIRKRREARHRGRSDAAQGGGHRQIEEAQRYVLSRYREEFGDKAESVAKLVDPSGRPAVLADRALEVAQRRASKNTQLGHAPVMKALDQTTRPIHGIAGGARAAVRGEDIPKAVERGVKLEDRVLFSDVLEEIGADEIPVVGKPLTAVAGFGLDVALDPTTYVTFGAGTVARKAAAQAGAKAAEKAVAKGLSPEQAKRMGERAARQAAERADQAKGVTVKVAGKEVPGVRRATAKAGKPVGKVLRRVTPERARTGARSVVADLNPNTAAAGASKDLSMEAVRATRSARAKTNRGRDLAQKRAIGVKRALSREDYGRVIDAIEAGRLGSLPDDLRRVAKVVRDDLRYANRLRKQAGIRGGERKNYVPHQLTEEALETSGRRKGGISAKVIRPAHTKARKDERTLKELREQEPGKYSENLPELFANRMAEGHQAVARAELNRRLADTGRAVKRGESVELKPGEAVFHVKGSDIRKVTDDAEVTKAASNLKPVVKNGRIVRVKGGTVQGGRYVVLPEDIVKRATEGVSPELQGPGIVRALDKGQALFKRIAIATPGFHVRNLLGDTQNAYLAQPARTLPGNLRRSAKVLKAAGRQDKANLKLKPEVIAGKSTLKTGQYGNVSYDEAARQLAEHGAFRTGYTAKEIPELADSGGGKIKTRTIVPEWLKRAGLNREDLPRLATAVDALRRGATWEQAAERVATFHFDYQHLTQFERNVARRAAPFYTWSARNIPLQARSLIQKPGKFAVYAKLREEAAKAFGADEEVEEARRMFEQLEEAGVELPDGWEKYLTEWEQRGAGIPISWGGEKFTLSFGSPLVDLNEFPGAAGKQQAQEYFQKAMSLVTPIAKNPVEYFSNYSFFFRDQLEREYSPNVAAPAYVAGFPDSLKRDIGVVKIRDKRSGEMVWAWPAKVDYIAKAVPGTPAFVQNMLTGGADRRERDRVAKAMGYMGIKAVPIDPVSAAVGLAYARMAEVNKALASERQQGYGRGNPSKRWRELSDQLKMLNEVAYQGKAARGDAVLPTNGAPPKTRVRKATPQRSSSSGFDVGDYGGSSDSGFDLSGLQPKTRVRKSSSSGFSISSY